MAYFGVHIKGFGPTPIPHQRNPALISLKYAGENNDIIIADLALYQQYISTCKGGCLWYALTTLILLAVPHDFPLCEAPAP